MKRLIPAAILLAAVVLIWIFGNAVIKRYCDKTERSLELCMSELKNGDESKAKSAAKRLEKEWDDDKMVLSIFVNHGLLDEISESLARMGSMVSTDEFAHFDSEYSLIRIKIHQIKAENGFDISAFY